MHRLPITGVEETLFSDGGFAIRGPIWVCIWRISSSVCLQGALEGMGVGSGSRLTCRQRGMSGTQSHTADGEEAMESREDKSVPSAWCDDSPQSWTAPCRSMAEAAQPKYPCIPGRHEEFMS